MASALAGGAALLAGSATASAQDYTYLLLVDYGPGETSVHPGNPSATVRVWATRPDFDYAMASMNLDLSAAEAGWTDFDLMLGVHGVFGASRGTLSADERTVDGILTGQFNILCGFKPIRTDRPTLIWEGTWTNEAADYTPRGVPLQTEDTTTYRVWATRNSCTSTNTLPFFVPGAGEITITPAPGSLACPVLAAGLARRRRGG